jgi:3-oxoacyl-[acyl-carrier-protein] synthase-3
VKSYHVRIAGTGSNPPSKVLTNEDLSKMVDTSDEWIVQRTGIKERRISAPNECPSDLASAAARKALEAAQVKPEDVDLIVVANTLADRIFPTTSCSVQEKLGCMKAGALDVNAACTGFVYLLNVVWGMVSSGRYKNVLCCGVETLTKMTNYKDRGTCIIFGDGAGAMVLQPSENPASDILAGELGADGKQGDLIQVPAGGARRPAYTPGVDPSEFTIYMNGKAVYKFAVQKFVDLAERAVAKVGLKLTDIDWLVPHQVNMRIIESACEKLNFPIAKTVINIHKYGNTSAASIPTAFDEAVRDGRIKRGHKVLMVAFGGGLTWGSVLLKY